MDRIAVLLDERGKPVMHGNDAVAVPMPDLGLRKEAHVSGNQIDVMHCPFVAAGP